MKNLKLECYHTTGDFLEVKPWDRPKKGSVHLNVETSLEGDGVILDKESAIKLRDYLNEILK